MSFKDFAFHKVRKFLLYSFFSQLFPHHFTWLLLQDLQLPCLLFFVGSHVVMECNVSSGINGLIPFWQVNDDDVDIFDKTYREQFYE